MKLEAVMQDMINTVIEQSDHHISHTLGRGLQINVIRKGNVISMIISRDNTYPSQLEYDIVMSYFPDEWEYPGYEKIEQSNRYWLRTYIQVPKEVKFGKPIFKFPK